MLLSGAADYFLECGNVDWGDNAKDCAVDCLIGMLPIPNPCGKFGQWFGMAAGAAGAAGGGLNSFAADTLVHVMPQGASEHDAYDAKAVLKPIGELKPGDKVLALAEWKEPGHHADKDQRLAYEKVTDVYTSRKEQVLVHLTLDNGDQLTATEGHPFKTSEGWRDAILLKRGGKLLLKGSDGDGSDRAALIADLRVERKTVQVFNLEVANAHTFFVGKDGALVHNGRRAERLRPDDSATGDHSTYRRNKSTGQVNHYQTWFKKCNPHPKDPHPWAPGPRFDLEGPPHMGVPTPHINMPDGSPPIPATGPAIPRRPI
jgi:hypothetical protein